VLGADLGLALTYAPVRERAALAALFAIDRAMGDVVRTTKETLLGPVRLAWWRERLEDLDAGISAPAEPRLVAVERQLLPRGVSGRDIAGLEGGWLRLFDPFPWGSETSEAIWFRGNLLFGLAAKVVNQPDPRIQTAGGLWALADAARHCSDAVSRKLLLDQSRTFARGIAGERFPTALRPLSALAAVAIRDARRGEPMEAEGTPGRAAAMLRHRFTGKLPVAPS
jgi:15-cis-phytoene synthase